jgi:protein-S-isoprenylcysteine O-methyltransferase Ste14
MTLFYWQFVSVSLLVACLASFAWSMRKFFARPAGDTAGMRVIKICGAVFAVLHLGAIAVTPRMTTGQGLAAALLYLSALGLFWWAIGTNSPRPLSAAFSPDAPQYLVERGPYRVIRHPFYCSYLLAWTAGIAATGRLWLLPSLAVMLIIYLRAARQEEQKFRSSPLAGPYQQYRSRTGLFLPNPVKLLMTRRSWSL